MSAPEKRPPVRRRFVIEVGQRCLGGTTVLITDEAGVEIGNFWSYYNGLPALIESVSRYLESDLAERPPVDRRGRIPWDETGRAKVPA